MPPVTIRLETPADHLAIKNVTTAAFGQKDEAQLIQRLREDGSVILSLVATNDAGRVIGHLMFTDLIIEGIENAAALAPMSVHPDHQKKRIGTAMIKEGLEICRSLEINVIVVLGHEMYYPRFGFSADLARCLDAPLSGPALMALELTPGTLSGSDLKVTYPAAFGI